MNMLRISGLRLSNNLCPEIVWVSFLFFLFHCVCNVHLNDGESEYAPLRSSESRTTYDTRCQCPWDCGAIAMVRCKVPSKRGVPTDRGGPNRSLISKFPLKIADIFLFFFSKISQILLKFYPKVIWKVAEFSPNLTVFFGIFPKCSIFLKDKPLAAPAGAASKGLKW